MDSVFFRYRSRDLKAQDIDFIQTIVTLCGPDWLGEHVRYLAFLHGQVVACLGWASAAFKVKDRDRFIGWQAPTRRKQLLFIANNVRCQTQY